MKTIIAKAYGFDALDGGEFDIIYDSESCKVVADNKEVPGTFNTIEEAISDIRNTWGDWETYTEIYGHKYYVVQIGTEYPVDDQFTCGFNYEAVLAAAQEFAANEAYDGQEIRIVDVDFQTTDKTEQGYVNSVEVIREGVN